MNIFELAGKITLDKSSLDSGLSHAESSAKAFGEKMDKIAGGVKKALTAAFSIAAVTKLTKSVMDLVNETAAFGDKIDKQSQALGMSRRAYQEWEYILAQSGASIDSLGFSMRTMNEAIAENSAETAAGLSQLGLSAAHLQSLNPEDQFRALVEAFQKMPPSAQKSQLAIKLFGRNAQSLMPLLNSSTESIDELRRQAEELGLIMGDDAVDASVAYGDAMDTLKRTFNALRYSLGARLLPTLTNGINAIISYAAKLRKAYEEKGFKGVWDTLVADFLNIKWPSWPDVSAAVTAGWNTIVRGVENLAGLVFGKNNDGTVNWPNWDDVLDFGKGLWDSLVGYVADLGGMIFGKNEEGEVNWPTLEDIWAWADHLWAQVVSYVNDFGGLVFGLNDDGSVAWPDINELIASFDTWWTDTALPALQGAMKWTLTLFGLPEETAEQIASVIGGWWDTVVKQAEGVLKWAMGLPDVPPHEAGEQLRALLEGWWNGIKSLFTGIFDLFFGVPKPQDEEGTSTKNNIVGWWIGKVKPILKDALDFTLGLFDLPDVEEMKKKIIDWWEKVKKAVGDLIINIGTALGFGTPDGTGEPVFYTNTNTGYGGGGGSFAKGLWSVPYDDFPARLHRGERVLTASQARRGESGINSQALYESVANAVSAAVSGIQINMDGKSVGNAVTGQVSRNLYQKQISRRFAAV